MESGVVRSDTGRYVKRDARREENAQRVVGELLLRFGITPHLSGFDPLCGAIRIASERDRTNVMPPFYRIQPMVGELCRESNPDHALRDAIGVGFLRTDPMQAQLFPFSDRPSIAEFVCTLAELARDRILPE